MVSNKVIAVSTLVAVAVGAVTLGAWGYFTKETYDEQAAKDAIEKLSDLYITAGMNYPDNKAHADFQFQLKANDLRGEIAEKNAAFPEFSLWAINFDDKVKYYRQKILKD